MPREAQPTPSRLTVRSNELEGIYPGAGGLSPPRRVGAGEIEQLPGPVGEAGDRAAGRPMGEVELVLADGPTGANSVDRHPHLHPVTARERKGGPEDVGAHRALPRD